MYLKLCNQFCIIVNHLVYQHRRLNGYKNSCIANTLFVAIHLVVTNSCKQWVSLAKGKILFLRIAFETIFILPSHAIYKGEAAEVKEMNACIQIVSNYDVSQ